MNKTEYVKMVAEKSKYNRKSDLDDNQKELYRKFSPDSFLGNAKTCENVILWTTFFRRNLHRFAIDYLGIKLYLYQIVWLYLMGVAQFFVVVASRASAKSFMIALYACCKCILYPGYKIILSSSTRGQSKLLISEKIEQDLMGKSPALRREIEKIIVNQSEMIVVFRNNSTIRVVPALDSARGSRSNVDIYISSSWFDNNGDEAWMWELVDNTYKDMLKGKPSYLLAFDESVALKHGLRTQKDFQKAKRKLDPISWRIEYLNERLKESRSAFFSWNMLNQNQTYKRPFYPRTILDYRSNKKNPYAIPKVVGEIRLVSCDMAFITNTKNDNSIFSCIRLLPENVSHKSDNGGDMTFDNGYRMIVPYLESIQGGETKKQAMRIRELFEDFDADYICLDTRNAGMEMPFSAEMHYIINAVENGKAEMLIRVEGYMQKYSHTQRIYSETVLQNIIYTRDCIA